MSEIPGTKELRSLARAYADVLGAQMQVGRELFQSFTGTALPDLTDTVATLRGGATKAKGRCGCHIPPPCWLPQPLGEVTSHVDDCHGAKLRLVITNCSHQQRTIQVQAQGHAAQVTFTPAGLSLGPYERGRIDVEFKPAAGAKDGDQYETILWVRGCREWYLRWTISVGTVGLDTRHEVRVEDCPDYVHHWYDHFYCQRGCSHVERTPGVLTHS